VWALVNPYANWPCVWTQIIGSDWTEAYLIVNCLSRIQYVKFLERPLPPSWRMYQLKMGRVCGFSTVVLQPTFHSESKLGAAFFQIHGMTVGIQLSGSHSLMIWAHIIFYEYTSKKSFMPWKYSIM
jgi:hypothetical protein